MCTWNHNSALQRIQLTADEGVVWQPGIPTPPQIQTPRLQSARAIVASHAAIEAAHRGIQARQLDGVCQARLGSRLRQHNLPEQFLINIDCLHRPALRRLEIGARGEYPISYGARTDSRFRIQFQLPQPIEGGIQPLPSFVRIGRDAPTDNLSPPVPSLPGGAPSDCSVFFPDYSMFDRKPIRARRESKCRRASANTSPVVPTWPLLSASLASSRAPVSAMAKARARGTTAS